jgi:hypothetical protein
MPDSTNCSSHSTLILPPPPEPDDACSAAARCIGPTNGASCDVLWPAYFPRSSAAGSASAALGAIVVSARRRLRCGSSAARRISPQWWCWSLRCSTAQRQCACRGFQRCSALAAEQLPAGGRGGSPPLRPVGSGRRRGPCSCCLPASLLERFAGGLEVRLIALLRFLGPITGGAAVHAA